MVKKIVILMFVVLFLTGCGETKEKEVKKDYSEYLFSDVVWTRDGGNDIETLVLKSDGSFRYYCSCGNPVNDSDLCESYTYDDNTKEIVFECFETTEDTITNIKVINSTETSLELDFNGEIRKFEKEKQKEILLFNFLYLLIVFEVRVEISTLLCYNVEESGSDIMSKTDNVNGYEGKKTINCLITISAIPLRNPYK